MSRYVKGIVTNIPSEKNIPVVQIERAIASVNEAVEADVRERFERDFSIYRRKLIYRLVNKVRRSKR